MSKIRQVAVPQNVRDLCQTMKDVDAHLVLFQQTSAESGNMIGVSRDFKPKTGQLGYLDYCHQYLTRIELGFQKESQLPADQRKALFTPEEITAAAVIARKFDLILTLALTKIPGAFNAPQTDFFDRNTFFLPMFLARPTLAGKFKHTLRHEMGHVRDAFAIFEQSRFGMEYVELEDRTDKRKDWQYHEAVIYVDLLTQYFKGNEFELAEFQRLGQLFLSEMRKSKNELSTMLAEVLRAGEEIFDPVTREFYLSASHTVSSEMSPWKLAYDFAKVRAAGFWGEYEMAQTIKGGQPLDQILAEAQSKDPLFAKRLRFMELAIATATDLQLGDFYRPGESYE